MASKPTHNIMMIANTINKGQPDEKPFYEKLGAAWVKETKLGQVISTKFFAYPANGEEIVFFPISEKPE